MSAKETPPPLRVQNQAGTVKIQPTRVLEISGATITKLGPGHARAVFTGGSDVVYAPTGGSYITIAAEADLTTERVLTAGDSVTLSSDATTVTINAVTSNIVYAATANQYVVIAAAGDLTAERVLTASNSITISSTATAVHIAANTADISGKANDSVTLTAGSGLAGGGNLTANREFSVNTDVRDKSFGFFGAGNLSTDMHVENARIFIPFNMTNIECQLASTTAPTGAALIVDVNQYNNVLGASTSMFTAANRPQIADGSNVGSSNTFAIGELYAGSYLGIDIDQVGSTNAGSNLTVTFLTRSS